MAVNHFVGRYLCTFVSSKLNKSVNRYVIGIGKSYLSSTYNLNFSNLYVI